jgi:hypothetical protein
MGESFVNPCQINILIVADGISLAFEENANFSLILLVKHLRHAKSPFVQFNIKTAHRKSDKSGADIPLYKFTDLSGFDEIWLFGQDSFTVNPTLSDSELEIIIKFMQARNGVFATGDHQDLGLDLNGRIPRVRSMRKWFYSNSPTSDPLLNAPSRDYSTRRDTLRKGFNNIYESVDETDDVPQEIEPIMYKTPNSPLYGMNIYPHPLLCGPRGVIKVLPDHMHEGECLVPQNLSAPLPLIAGSEYPLLTNVVRISPQIVAWSNIVEPHTTQEGPVTREAVSTGKFAAICAYDGHPVKVGRVVVESSFHHFLYGNLKGFESSRTDEGRLAYQDIQSYYQNLGVWLAPPEKQKEMLRSSLWLTRCSFQIETCIKTMQATIASSTEKVFAVGAVARQVHSRLTSNCLTVAWIVNWIDDLLSNDESLQFLNPWLQLSPPPVLASLSIKNPPIDTELIVDAVLGGLILEIAKRFESENDATAEDSETKMDEAMKIGLLMGLRAYSDSLQRSQNLVEEVIAKTIESI